MLAATPLPRREAIVALGAGAAAFACSTAGGGPAGAAAIDGHIHVWTADLERYPLAAGWTRESMQPASFTPEEFFAHARPEGVGRAVLIQMSFYGFDNSYMLDQMAAAKGAFAGVAVVDESKRPAQEMRRLARLGVKGFRIHPGDRPPYEWLGSDGMAEMWRTGGEERLAMCCLINPNALPLVEKMARRFPRTPVVIDHFARIGIDGDIRERDVENLLRLSDCPETLVKVSAFYALGKKKAPYLDLAPMIRRLLGAFGSERLLWASDCPYQVQDGHTYRESIALVRERLDFLTKDDRANLLSNTSERVFFSRG